MSVKHKALYGIVMSGLILSVSGVNGGIAPPPPQGCPNWSVNLGYRNTMTVHASVRLPDGSFVSAPNSRLSVFHNGVVCGVADLMKGPATSPQFGLSVGNSEGVAKGLRVQVYDAAADRVHEVQEAIDFAADSTLGQIAAPIVLTAGKELKSTLELSQQDRAFQWAFAFASAIPADPHITSRSSSQYAVLKRWLELCGPDPVVSRADSVLDWQGAVIYTDLAAVYAEPGRTDWAMTDYLLKARRLQMEVTGANEGWQKERIAAHIAVVQAKAGQFDEADATAKGVQDTVLARIVPERYGRIDSEEDYESKMATLAEIGATVHFEFQEAVIEAYIRILTEHGAQFSVERCGQIVELVLKLAEKLPAAMQCPSLTAAARALFKISRRELGIQLLRNAVAAIDRRGADARSDIAALVEVADAYREVDSTQATSLLQRAADLLTAKSLADRSDRAAATSALAAGFLRQGDPTMAWRHYLVALDVAQSQVNGRPRHMMLAAICLSLAQHDAAWPVEIEQQLSQQWHRRGAPW